MAPPLTPNEVARFRALVKAAAVVLLMLRLDRPAGAREIADILGLEEHTAARYLRHLSQINIVARTGHRGGYALIGGHQLILGSERTVENLQFDPTTTRDIDIKNESLEVVVDSARSVEKLQFEGPPPVRKQELQQPDLPPTEQALKEAGIGEPKRSALACLPHVTPEYIQAWEANLKHVKGKRYTPGLLIHVLESGDPAPPVNQNGHHVACNCQECQYIKYRTCWYCKSYPCVCPTEDEDDDEAN